MCACMCIEYISRLKSELRSEKKRKKKSKDDLRLSHPCRG